MKNLEKLQNRRKAVIYISSGYDFNPFEQSRLEEQAQRMHVESSDLQNDPFYRTQQSSQLLAESDLIRELAELTRAANRANATLYTIDPRGLVAGQDLDDEVPTQEWNAYVRDTQDSLRVLVEVVLVDDGDAAGLLGEHAQAVLRLAHVCVPLLRGRPRRPCPARRPGRAGRSCRSSRWRGSRRASARPARERGRLRPAIWLLCCVR